MDCCRRDYRGLRLLQGYVKKEKSGRRQWTSRVCLRYFVLDLTSGVLQYRRRLESSKVRRSHRVTDILTFGPGNGGKSLHVWTNLVGNGKENEDWSYPFWILTRQRHYSLLACTKAVQETWLEALSALQLPLPPLYYSTLTASPSIPEVSCEERC